MMDSPDDEREWLPPGAEEDEQEDLIEQAEREELADRLEAEIGAPRSGTLIDQLLREAVEALREIEPQRERGPLEDPTVVDVGTPPLVYGRVIGGADA